MIGKMFFFGFGARPTCDFVLGFLCWSLQQVTAEECCAEFEEHELNLAHELVTMFLPC